MLQNIEITKVLFLDIETAPCAESLLEAPDHIADCWAKKSEKKWGDESPMDTFLQHSALFGEYNKIACISFGIMKDGKFNVNSLFGSNERAILEGFSKILSKPFFNTASFCAHNGMGFDFPVIAKRCLANGLQIPTPFDSYGKKPWEMTHLIDTLSLWKGTAWGTGGTLDELCAVFQVPSPKIDMDGSMVKEKYYTGEHFRIAQYCEKDVIALCRVFQGMKLVPKVVDENVIIKTKKEEEKIK